MEYYNVIFAVFICDVDPNDLIYPEKTIYWKLKVCVV